MKFTLETRVVHEDSVMVSVIKDADTSEDTVLGTLECNLTFRDGKIVLDMTAHRSNVLPIIEFNFAKVSEVHRTQPA